MAAANAQQQQEAADRLLGLRLHGSDATNRAHDSGGALPPLPPLPDPTNRDHEQQFYAIVRFARRDRYKQINNTVCDYFGLYVALHKALRKYLPDRDPADLTDADFDDKIWKPYFWDIFTQTKNYNPSKPMAEKKRADVYFKLFQQIVVYRLVQLSFDPTTPGGGPPARRTGSTGGRAADTDGGRDEDENEGDGEEDDDATTVLRAVTAQFRAVRPADASQDPRAFLKKFIASLERLQDAMESSQDGSTAALQQVATIRNIAAHTLHRMDELGAQRIALLGETGAGKSRALNTLLQVTEVDPANYNAGRAKNLVPGQRALAKLHSLRGLDYDPATGGAAWPVAVVTDDADAPTDDAVAEEEELLAEVRAAAFAAAPAPEVASYSFLLPVAGTELRATTAHSIHLLQGNVYELLVRLHTEEDLLEMLQMAQERYSKSDDADYKDELIRGLRDGLLSVAPASAGARRSGDIQPGVVFVNAKMLEAAITFGTPRITMPMLELTPEAKELLRNDVRLWSGDGANMVRDRLYIRDRLAGMASHPVGRFLIKDVYVFAPSAILAGGQEIVDCPGVGDADMFKQLSTKTCMDTAHSVLVILNKDLKTHGPTYEFLRNHLLGRVLETALSARARTAGAGTAPRVTGFRLHIMGVLEQNTYYRANPLKIDHFAEHAAGPKATKTAKARETALKSVQTWEQATRSQLWELMKDVAKAKAAEADVTPAVVLAAAEDAVATVRVFACWPVLWSSAFSHCPGFLERSEAAVRALEFSGGREYCESLLTFMNASLPALEELYAALAPADTLNAEQYLRKSVGDFSGAFPEVLQRLETLVGKGRVREAQNLQVTNFCAWAKEMVDKAKSRLRGDMAASLDVFNSDDVKTQRRQECQAALAGQAPDLPLTTGVSKGRLTTGRKNPRAGGAVAVLPSVNDAISQWLKGPVQVALDLFYRLLRRELRLEPAPAGPSVATSTGSAQAPPALWTLALRYIAHDAVAPALGNERKRVEVGVAYLINDTPVVRDGPTSWGSLIVSRTGHSIRPSDAQLADDAQSIIDDTIVSLARNGKFAKADATVICDDALRTVRELTFRHMDQVMSDYLDAALDSITQTSSKRPPIQGYYPRHVWERALQALAKRGDPELARRNVRLIEEAAEVMHHAIRTLERLGAARAELLSQGGQTSVHLLREAAGARWAAAMGAGAGARELLVGQKVTAPQPRASLHAAIKEARELKGAVDGAPVIVPTTWEVMPTYELRVAEDDDDDDITRWDQLRVAAASTVCALLFSGFRKLSGSHDEEGIKWLWAQLLEPCLRVVLAGPRRTIAGQLEYQASRVMVALFGGQQQPPEDIVNQLEASVVAEQLMQLFCARFGRILRVFCYTVEPPPRSGERKPRTFVNIGGPWTPVEPLLSKPDTSAKRSAGASGSGAAKDDPMVLDDDDDDDDDKDDDKRDDDDNGDSDVALNMLPPLPQVFVAVEPRWRKTDGVLGHPMRRAARDPQKSSSDVPHAADAGKGAATRQTTARTIATATKREGHAPAAVRPAAASTSATQGRRGRPRVIPPPASTFTSPVLLGVRRPRDQSAHSEDDDGDSNNAGSAASPSRNSPQRRRQN